eukprot:scaffold1042_cov401-Prasinococcus_capsulatus_cf.AAC.19
MSARVELGKFPRQKFKLTIRTSVLLPTWPMTDNATTMPQGHEHTRERSTPPAPAPRRQLGGLPPTLRLRLLATNSKTGWPRSLTAHS